MRSTQPFATALILVAVGVVYLFVGFDVQSQEVPRDEYLKYIPLKYPTIVRQTKASVEVNLFGDTNQDTDPVDGIDDHRHKVLLDLAVRFAPYLVLNSTLIPMDFRLFMEREDSFPLFVDSWDVSRYIPRRVRSEEIDWQSLSRSTSEAGSQVPNAGTPDCRLLSLLKAFDPFVPGAAYRSGAAAPDGAEHQVMFFDFPGDGEKTWEQEYVDQESGALPQSYEGFAKVFVHPFVESMEVESSVTGHQGYEFVLQYWFFYPYNDGGNNHEGDWEHINVSIKPLDKLHEPLSMNDVRRILAGGGSSDTAPDRLVIQRVDYYFHHKVMTLDYTEPDVYQSREDWKTQCKKIAKERGHPGEMWIWELVRYRAYWDDYETIINTNPIGFIGGDNKGTDQLMKFPGDSNRVSNGTYPFSGLYKNVGVIGAAEQISRRFDHRKDLAAGDHNRAVPKGGYRRGKVVSFASPDRIEILPDAERVVDLVKADTQARRDWAWLVLPIRWGYPATKFLFEGIIKHTDLGNISVVGPSYNAGWNRSGNAPGFQVYSPYTFPSMFRVTWQDSFVNNFGFWNLPYALLAMVPPSDVVFHVARVAQYTVRSIQDSYEDYLVFKPNGSIPYRFVSWMSLGRAWMVMSPGSADLVLNPKALNAVANRLTNTFIQGKGHHVEKLPFLENADMYQFEIALYLGERFATENLLRTGNPMIGYDFTLPVTKEVFQLRGTLNFYEYSSSLRYNLKTGKFMIFAKGGYGLSWYRLREISANGKLLPVPEDPWINPTLHFGGGIEWLPFPMYGANFSIRGDAIIYRHFGTDTKAIVLTPSGISMSRDSVTSPPIKRLVFTLALTYAL